ncbi:MAG: nuclear transport factor 2 family protein [Actinomycetota bacterium]
MEPWELAAREAIRETVACYAHCGDSGRFDELVELFTPDGVLEVHGEARLEGRAAIRAFLDDVARDLAAHGAVPMLRHHVSNLTITFASLSEARAACYFLAVTAGGPDHCGRYRDVLRPDTPSGRWLFAHRLVRTDDTVVGGFAATRTPPR